MAKTPKNYYFVENKIWKFLPFASFEKLITKTTFCNAWPSPNVMVNLRYLLFNNISEVFSTGKISNYKSFKK